MKLVNINKSYGALKVLENFNMNFEEGEITCLLGPSGCGKTTVLNVISRLTDFEGEIKEPADKISYIFQTQRLLPNLTVYGNLDFVLQGAEKDKAIRRQKIYDILSAVELDSWKDAYPGQLSGGMAQRVALARAFVYPSTLLLMDEPFKELDISLKKRLVAVFLKLWAKDKRTVVFVTHDIDEALLLADNITLLSHKAKILHTHKIDLPQAQRQLSDDILITIRKDIYKNFD
ncbi:MAG: ABC transporter ATP-binding protein [Clostridia bacterium]|nr:ABC transporter ATP-binding protein [Clostridia bacterium]